MIDTIKKSMEWKAILKRTVVLLCVLCILVFSACSNPQTNDADDDDDRTHSSKDDTDATVDGDSDENTDDADDDEDDEDDEVIYGDIHFLTAFNEGKAFIQYDFWDTLCIDKLGNVLFELSDEYSLPNTPSGFHNGLAVVSFWNEDNEHMYALCKENGTIVKPEDVGATDFAIAPSNNPVLREAMFADGYILTYNIRSNSEGIITTMEAGILSPKLEWIVPLSESFYNAISIYEELTSVYHAGYLIILDYGYIDLRTGRADTDFTKLYDAPFVQYASDFWEGVPDPDGVIVYDDRDGTHFDRESVLDISMYDYIYTSFTFENGIAPVFFGRDGATKFSLLKEDGTLCFEPVSVIDDYCLFDESTGTYLISGEDEKDYLVLELFDKTGMIRSISLKIEMENGVGSGVGYFSDGLIHICTMYEENENSYNFTWDLMTAEFEWYDDYRIIE